MILKYRDSFILCLMKIVFGRFKITLKDPNYTASAIFDAIEIIEIAWWNLIALLWVVLLKVCLIIFSSFTVISFVSTCSK